MSAEKSKMQQVFLDAPTLDFLVMPITSTLLLDSLAVSPLYKGTRLSFLLSLRSTT